MTDFVYDNTSVPSGKSDLRPLTGIPAQHVTAAEWNTVMAAVTDLRDAILTGNYHGLISDPAAAVSPTAGVRLRNNAGTFQASENAGIYRTLSDKDIFRVEDYGAVGDGGTDDRAAIQAAIDATASSVSSKGKVVQLSSKTYHISGPIYLKRSVQLRGVGNQGFYSATKISVTGGQTAIIIDNIYTSSDGGSGSWSHISDMQIESATQTGSADGVVFKTRASMDRVRVDNFGGNGISINCDVGMVPSQNGNLWTLYDCYTDQNLGHGLYINGGDSNGGVSIKHQSDANGGYGIYDSSFLANTHIGSHTQGNKLGGYFSDDPNASTVFMGCYSEGDEPASSISYPAIIIGGVLSLRLGTSTCITLKSGINRPMTFKVDSVGSVQIGTLGSNPNSYLIMGNPDNGSDFTFRYEAPGGYSKFFSFKMTESGSGYGLMFANTLAQIPGPKQIAQGTPVFPFSYFLKKAHITSDSAIPAEGTWDVGDQIWDSAPTAGGMVGWLCATAGTAGTYSEGRTATTNGTTAVTLNSSSSILIVGDRVTMNGTPVFITALSGTSMTVSGSISAGGPGLAIAYTAPTWSRFGKITGGIPDSTGSPGAATQNTRRGRVAIAAGSPSVVVTNNLVTATSIVHATLQTVDGTLTQILSAVPGAGSFTIAGNANATGTVKVCWSLEE